MKANLTSIHWLEGQFDFHPLTWTYCQQLLKTLPTAFYWDLTYIGCYIITTGKIERSPASLCDVKNMTTEQDWRTGGLTMASPESVVRKLAWKSLCRSVCRSLIYSSTPFMSLFIISEATGNSFTRSFSWSTCPFFPLTSRCTIDLHQLAKLQLICHEDGLKTCFHDRLLSQDWKWGSSIFSQSVDLTYIQQARPQKFCKLYILAVQDESQDSKDCSRHSKSSTCLYESHRIDSNHDCGAA